jgi:hypothetical protein
VTARSYTEWSIRCDARPTHAEGCPLQTDSQDHHTAREARDTAKYDGWTRKRRGTEMVDLSPQCSTPARPSPEEARDA